MSIYTPVHSPVARPYVLHQMHVCGCVRFYLYARSTDTPYIAKNFTPLFLPIKVPGLCYSIYSDCCWLASSLCYRLLYHCLLSFWCYRSPVRTDCSRVCPRQLKMVSSDYVKQRIVFYRRLGKSFVQITGCLTEEGHAMTKFTYKISLSSTTLRRCVFLGKMHKQF